MNIADLKIDRKLEEEGGWFPYPRWPGVRFHVRGSQSKGFTEAQRRTTTSRQWERASADERYKLNASDICDHLLLGWDGFDEAFSAEKARELLLNSEYREITTAVLWCAQQASSAPVARFRLPESEEPAEPDVPDQPAARAA